MEMRKSNVLRKLRAGEAVHSFKLNFADGRIAEVAAMHDFDCIWVCMEHIANDWSAIERQIWAAKTRDMDVMVRVPRGSYSDYIRPLEMDAAGIMVPHVMSARDAREVVRITRFQPIGRRPVDGGNADACYCNVDFKEYVATANNERFLAVQIEDPEPLSELDAIAELDGIDMLFFGPGDFSHGIGAPGEWENPKIHDARKRVVQAALRHGKYAGTTGSLSNLGELLDMGYRFINIGADVIGLNEYCSRIASEFRAKSKS